MDIPVWLTEAVMSCFKLRKTRKKCQIDLFPVFNNINPAKGMRVMLFFAVKEASFHIYLPEIPFLPVGI